MANDPCSCFATPGVQVAPSCPSDNCLFIPYLTVNQVDSVAPCGGSGTATFPSVVNFPDGCTPTFQEISSDNTNATIDTIDSNGFSFSIAGTLTTATEFKFLVKCASGESQYFCIKVYPKLLCNGIVCPTDYTCNVCTGICDVDGPDLEID